MASLPDLTPEQRLKAQALKRVTGKPPSRKDIALVVTGWLALLAWIMLRVWLAHAEEEEETPWRGLETRPNSFGGESIWREDGQRFETRPSALPYSLDVYDREGRRVATCRPNHLGGVKCE